MLKKNPQYFSAPVSRTQTWSWGEVNHTTMQQGFLANNTVVTTDSHRNWRDLLRTGQSATTELVGDREEYLGEELFYWSRDVKPPYTGPLVTVSGMPDPRRGLAQNLGLSPLTTKANNQAAERVVSQYRDATTAFKSLSFAAELGDVIKMFRKPVESMYSLTMMFLLDVTRIRKGTRRRELYAAHLGDAWLTYAFGIAPLASDIATATAEAVLALERLGLPYQKSISGKAVDYVSGTSIDNEDVLYCTYAQHSVSERRKTEVHYYGKVTVSGQAPELLDTFGFSLPEVLPAVWEGIPLSFITDYFTNVSSVLYRGGLGSGTARLAWLNRGVRNTSEVTGSPYRIKPSPDVSSGEVQVFVSGGSFRTRRVRVHRLPWEGLPPVELELRFPSVKQWFNLAALSAAVRASKPPAHWWEQHDWLDG